jgi:hypothetical protein
MSDRNGASVKDVIVAVWWRRSGTGSRMSKIHRRRDEKAWTTDCGAFIPLNARTAYGVDAPHCSRCWREE